MSTTNAPFGFQPVYHASGFVRPAAFTLADNAAVTLLQNQPVKLSTDGVVVPATVGDPLVGTFQGVEFTDGDGRRRDLGRPGEADHARLRRGSARAAIMRR